MGVTGIRYCLFVPEFQAFCFSVCGFNKAFANAYFDFLACARFQIDSGCFDSFDLFIQSHSVAHFYFGDRTLGSILKGNIEISLTTAGIISVAGKFGFQLTEFWSRGDNLEVDGFA